MSKGETMKPQAFIEVFEGENARRHYRCPCQPADMPDPGTFSLLPGSDWFLFGGVAIQADPCLDEDCWDGVLGPDCNAPCPKCHGLGVIPQHGSIQRLPVHWSKTNEDGSFSGGFAEKRCVVVPIEGDE